MKKILVIEDTKILRMGIVQALQCLDFEVQEAENGEIGIELAKLHLPDLIICDVMMPGIDGYGVYEALRQDPATVAIPFIFLTAKADKSDIRRGMNLGADDYLTKPCKISDLKEAIDSRLKKRSVVKNSYTAEIQHSVERSSSELANRDGLTNLPNRILFQQELQQAILECDRNQQAIALLFIDLHRFKQVNTNYGHGVGDLLLQSVAERLTTSIKQHDKIIARIDADVFAVILLNITDRSAVELSVQQLLDVLSQPYGEKESQISMESSIGITVYPEDNTSLDKLLIHAEMSMDCAKQLGKSGYQFYQAEMGALSEKRQLLEKSLEQALENSEFQVYYQPQINLTTRSIIGAEALLRWRHAELGNISPAIFIPMAEETDLIIKIGEWVLKTVCTQAKNWQQFSSTKPFRIAVNLSARQFRSQNLVETITQILNETELEPHCLELELTETSLVGDVDYATSLLQQLKAMGIQISIDDFGTGYSSLNYLKRLPLDILKVDRSFIHDIFHDQSDAVIVKTIITMAQNLNLKVVAEGVETKEQFDFLQEQKCQMMQGYLFSPAVPAEQFEALLVAGKKLEFD